MSRGRVPKDANQTDAGVRRVAVVALIVGEMLSSWREKRRKGDRPSSD
jgi:hypothetical protein